jgi:2-C-methyl-D-erythritol 4-phosphate cytidylyltransferase
MNDSYRDVEVGVANNESDTMKIDTENPTFKTLAREDIHEVQAYQHFRSNSIDDKYFKAPIIVPTKVLYFQIC